MSYANKARAYYRAVSAHDVAAVTAMVRADYIQHNPFLPTGRAPFLAFLGTLKAHGARIVNLRMIEDGPFVAMHHVWENAAPFGAERMAAFHVVRFDPDGLVAEHWNVMAQIGAPNRSGRSRVDGPVEICDRDRTEANRARVIALSAALAASSQARPHPSGDVLGAHVDPALRQHHPALGDGVAALRAVIAEGALAYARTHRVFAEGNFALAISEGMLRGEGGDEPAILYDLWRLEDAKVAEHWSVHQRIPTTGIANDHSMFGF